MRTRLRPVLCTLLCLSSPVAFASPCADESEIRKFKLESWPKAYRDQDVAALGGLLHPDFRMVDAKGAVTTRAEELDWLKNNAWTARDFRYEVQSVACVGDTAVVIGTGSTARADGSGRSSYVSSNTLVRAGGRWQAVVSHISGVSN